VKNTSKAIINGMDGDQRIHPIKAMRPLTYIGSRTCRYNPVTTSSLGGSMGAGVPRPFTVKSQKHQIIIPALIAHKGIDK